MRKLGPFILSSLLSVLALISPASLYGQTPTYTIPQTVQQVLTAGGIPNTGDTCTGSTQSYKVKNLGQTQHYATVFLFKAGGPPLPRNTGQARIQIAGVDQNNNLTIISDQMEPGQAAGVSMNYVLQGTGYYPIVEVQITCTAGDLFTITYSGTSATPNVNVSAYQFAQVDKVPFVKSSATATQTDSQLITPFVNSAGTLIFTADSAVTSSTVTLTCTGASGQQTQSPIVFNPSNSLSPQIFAVPAGPCPLVSSVYTAGSGGSTFTLEYIFTAPGLLSAAGGASNVNVADYGGSAVSLGQKTMSASMPVAIASDQSSVQVNCVTGCSGSTTGATGLNQPLATFNSEQTSGTNAAVTKSITGVASKRVFLYGVTVRCSAGNASLTVKDGVSGTVIWSSDAAFAGTSSTAVGWTSSPLASSTNAGMDIVLGACGASNTGTLDVQASQL